MAVHARVGGAQGADGRGEGANPAPAPAFSSRRRRRLCGSARRRPPGSQLPPSLPAWPRGVGLFLWLPCRRVGGTQEYPGCRAVCIAGGSSLPLSGAACGWGGGDWTHAARAARSLCPPPPPSLLPPAPPPQALGDAQHGGATLRATHKTLSRTARAPPSPPPPHSRLPNLAPRLPAHCDGDEWGQVGRHAARQEDAQAEPAR